MSSTIATRVLLCRRDLKWDQDDLAKLANVSRAYVSDLERGKTTNPTMDVIEALAKALGVRPEYLAGWSDDALGEDRPANVASGHLVYDAATPDERRRVQEALDLLHELTPEYQGLAIQVMETFRRASNVRIIGDE